MALPLIGLSPLLSISILFCTMNSIPLPPLTWPEKWKKQGEKGLEREWSSSSGAAQTGGHPFIAGEESSSNREELDIGSRLENPELSGNLNCDYPHEGDDLIRSTSTPEKFMIEHLALTVFYAALVYEYFLALSLRSRTSISFPIMVSWTRGNQIQKCFLSGDLHHSVAINALEMVTAFKPRLLSVNIEVSREGAEATYLEILLVPKVEWLKHLFPYTFIEVDLATAGLKTNIDPKECGYILSLTILPNEEAELLRLERLLQLILKSLPVFRIMAPGPMVLAVLGQFKENLQTTSPFDANHTKGQLKRQINSTLESVSKTPRQIPSVGTNIGSLVSNQGSKFRGKVLPFQDDLIRGVNALRKFMTELGPRRSQIMKVVVNIFFCHYPRTDEARENIKPKARIRSSSRRGYRLHSSSLRSIFFGLAAATVDFATGPPKTERDPKGYGNIPSLIISSKEETVQRSVLGELDQLLGERSSLLLGHLMVALDKPYEHVMGSSELDSSLDCTPRLESSS
ncbi:hypothetical protein Cgig2_001078 [Carnegiea gigantea]|uniref:Uncharacterized protein n=1 Tax=Carnegiea gigantea TaxID=171969 RepID=A0A9Q1QDQ4_9CARY|nr:hypothetical protein Cgig2_001078 [Carnegiea gigantea]